MYRCYNNINKYCILGTFQNSSHLKQSIETNRLSDVMLLSIVLNYLK